MKKNMGIADRIIRILAAAAIAILYFTNQISGAPGIILLIFAGVLILTSIINFCPLYLLFKINTNKKSSTV